jgi:hypothetical protein
VSCSGTSQRRHENPSVSVYHVQVIDLGVLLHIAVDGGSPLGTSVGTILWGYPLEITLAKILRSQEVVSLANIEERGLRKFFVGTVLEKMCRAIYCNTNAFLWMKFYLIFT